MSLQSVTEKLREKIGTGGRLGKSIKFDFAEDGVIRIDDSKAPATVDNEDSPADCTIRVSLADFKNIATGNQSPQMAFMTGKLKIEGDMSVALQLGSLLD